MKIRAGYRISYESPKPTPMILALRVHPSRESNLVVRDDPHFDAPVELREYCDGFGNRCGRIVAPTGPLTISTNFLINDDDLRARCLNSADGRAVRSRHRFHDEPLLSGNITPILLYMSRSWRPA